MSSWDPNQGQQPPQNPGTNPYGYGGPENPYSGTPENPYAGQTSDPYSAPQNPYGNMQPPPANQPDYGYNYGAGAAGTAAAPLPLSQAIQQLPNQYIRVLTKPSPQTFAEEQGKAAWDIVWIQLLIYAVIGALLGFVANLTSPARYSSFTGTPSTVNTSSLSLISLGSSIGAIVFIPLVFFIGQGIYFGLSKAFGGQGTFLRQSYANLLYAVPLGIITSLLNIIPIAGAFLGLAVSIYGIVLNIFSIMAVHRLSGGKASAVVLIPLAALFLLACLCIVFFAALIVSLVNGARTTP